MGKGESEQPKKKDRKQRMERNVLGRGRLIFITSPLTELAEEAEAGNESIDDK